jgi:hypothetical protein
MILFTFSGQALCVFLGNAFMSLFQFLAAPARRTLRIFLSLLKPLTIDTKPEIEPSVVPQLSTRVAGPRQTS